MTARQAKSRRLLTRRARVGWALAACAGRAALAATKSYVGPHPGNWSDGANWSPGGQPLAGDDVRIFAGSNFRSVYFDPAATTAALRSLLVDSGTGGQAWLAVAPHQTVSTAHLVVGGAGVGHVDNGSLDVNSTGTNGLYIGRDPWSNGTVTLGGGSYPARIRVATDEYVGHRGSGTFTHWDGDHTVAGSLVIAAHPGSAGTYDFRGGQLTAGSIRLNAGGRFDQGSAAATASLTFGTFAQSGGTHVAKNFSIDRADGANSQYLLSGGTLQVTSDLRLAHRSPASFVHTGGRNEAHVLQIGDPNRADGPDGAYSLGGGGVLQTRDLWISHGTFSQSGGSNSTRSLYLGRGNFASDPARVPTYELSGGELSSDSTHIANRGSTNFAGTSSATFVQTGGTHRVGFRLSVNGDAAGRGCISFGAACSPPQGNISGGARAAGRRGSSKPAAPIPPPIT